MKARIIMVFGKNEYYYGTYPFNTPNEQNRANEIALKVREERDCDTYIETIEDNEV